MTRNMVFTSAGDNTNFHELWCHTNIKSDYDIFVVYYGNDNNNYETYKNNVQWIDKHKGSKFQNFYWFYQNHPEILEQYDYFFILDDDIIFYTLDINQMFSIAREYELSICQPSFTKESKISHAITLQKESTILRYTNFVEVNTPLFTKEALVNAMNVMDSSLIEYGVDYLYIWANGIDKKNKYAIIDMITCTNPHDNQKKIKIREIDTIDPKKIKADLWRNHCKKIGCPQEFLSVTHYLVPL